MSGASIPEGFGRTSYTRWRGKPADGAFMRAPVPLGEDEWLAGMQPWSVMSDADLGAIREYAERELANHPPDWLEFHYDTLLAGCLAECQRRAARASSRFESAGRFSAAFLLDLKRREPLAEYCVYRGVSLKRSGHDRYVGVCPFHSERTPSFTVWDGEDLHYHCFGCGASGDLFTFIEDLDGCDFVQAVKAAAEYARVEMPGCNPPPIYKRTEYRP